MLYTTMPMEAIFPATDDVTVNALVIKGRLCLVRRGIDGYVRIERLLSTDPQDYLQADWAPATGVEWFL